MAEVKDRGRNSKRYIAFLDYKTKRNCYGKMHLEFLPQVSCEKAGACGDSALNNTSLTNAVIFL